MVNTTLQTKQTILTLLTILTETCLNYVEGFKIRLWDKTINFCVELLFKKGNTVSA